MTKNLAHIIVIACMLIQGLMGVFFAYVFGPYEDNIRMFGFTMLALGAGAAWFSWVNRK